MKKTLFPLLAVLFVTACANRPKTLKEALADKFMIGTALNTAQIEGSDTLGVELIESHFNTIVAEDCMKCEKIHPEKEVYAFDLPDKFVDFGERNGMFVVGHTLVWHAQLAPWFCVDDAGEQVSREEMIARMKEHIQTVVGRYKGRVHGWDVVNEAVNEDGSMRQNQFMRIIGEEYIPLAFRFAHEADPDAELYYNDFGMAAPGRRETVVALVRDLKAQGLRIDGVGMQGHVGMDYPQLDEFEKSVEAFAAEGMKVMITELDLTVLPTVTQGAEIGDRFEYKAEMNPYPDGMTAEAEELWNERVRAFFELFLRHSDVITRVTAWGLTDGDSWRNNWPMPGRRDYPLLFDRNHQLKPAVAEVVGIK